jgi:hypothetical protein
MVSTVKFQFELIVFVLVQYILEFHNVYCIQSALFTCRVVLNTIIIYNYIFYLSCMNMIMFLNNGEYFIAHVHIVLQN